MSTDAELYLPQVIENTVKNFGKILQAISCFRRTMGIELGTTSDPGPRRFHDPCSLDLLLLSPLLRGLCG
jgi:hypothetical protein